MQSVKQIATAWMVRGTNLGEGEKIYSFPKPVQNGPAVNPATQSGYQDSSRGQSGRRRWELITHRLLSLTLCVQTVSMMMST